MKAFSSNDRLYPTGSWNWWDRLCQLLHGSLQVCPVAKHISVKFHLQLLQSGQPQLWSPTSWWSRIWLASRFFHLFLKKVKLQESLRFADMQIQFLQFWSFNFPIFFKCCSPSITFYDIQSFNRLWTSYLKGGRYYLYKQNHFLQQFSNISSVVCPKFWISSICPKWISSICPKF